MTRHFNAWTRLRGHVARDVVASGSHTSSTSMWDKISTFSLFSGPSCDASYQGAWFDKSVYELILDLDSCRLDIHFGSVVSDP